MPTWLFAETIVWAVAFSRDYLYSNAVRRIIGEYAVALLDSYVIDDEKAKLIKEKDYA